ncbi:hypothetical protein C4K88_16655 [Arthrobacter pityocampae]|uniref:DUF2975 domain-containing protein n=1 Tax=Arthrobacter pityocampae TaxID=547334 RepID=A0A2S5ITH6_9MICC|nr:hypothetical protein [Arthrobacter pityocampae]PPB47861.1 hypothetical protein C4K88_16655 [Arthrobacter pityocampae]
MVDVTRAALVLLFLGTILGQVVVVRVAQSMAEAYPEFVDLQVPLVSAAISFGVCMEVVLVLGGVLLGSARDGCILEPIPLRLTGIMAGTLAVATAIVMVTLFVIPGPPALGLLLIGGALVGLISTLVLLALRSRLHRTALEPSSAFSEARRNR